MKLSNYINKKNQIFIQIIMVILICILVTISNPFYINSYNIKFISDDLHELLNSYEGIDILNFETNENGEQCLKSYDVGDGVITFGYGNTFPSEAEGIVKINELTDSNYKPGDCILVTDLEILQDEAIQERVDDILYYDKKYKANLNQQQFDAIFLLYYLNESTIANSTFWLMITNPQLTKEEYINYFVSQYSLFNQFDTYGEGWTLRINDSADVFFDGDYVRDYE